MDEWDVGGGVDAMIWIFNIPYRSAAHIYYISILFEYKWYDWISIANCRSMWRPSSLGTCFRTRPKKKTIWEKTKKHKSRSVYRIRIGLLFSMIYLENRYTNICSSSMFNAKKSAHKGVFIIRTPCSVWRIRVCSVNVCDALPQTCVEFTKYCVVYGFGTLFLGLKWLAISLGSKWRDEKTFACF